MNVRELLEAKYAFRQDSKCHSCGNEFKYSEAIQHSFWKDSASCPQCEAGNEESPARRRYYDEHK